MSLSIESISIVGADVRFTIAVKHKPGASLKELLETVEQVSERLTNKATVVVKQPIAEDYNPDRIAEEIFENLGPKPYVSATYATKKVSSADAKLNFDTLGERLCVAAATATTIEELIEVMEIYKEELDKVHHKTRGKFIRDAYAAVSSRGRIKMTAEEIGLAMEQTSGKRLVEEDKVNKASFQEVTRVREESPTTAPTPAEAPSVPASTPERPDTPTTPTTGSNEAAEPPSVDAALIALDRNPMTAQDALNKAKAYTWFFQTLANVAGTKELDRGFVEGVLQSMQTGPGVLSTADGRSAMLQAMTGGMRVFYENTTKCKIR